MRKKATSNKEELRSQSDVRTIRVLRYSGAGSEENSGEKVLECDLNGTTRRRLKMLRSMA